MPAKSAVCLVGCRLLGFGMATQPGQRNQCNTKRCSLPGKIPAMRWPVRTDEQAAAYMVSTDESRRFHHSGLRSLTAGVLLYVTRAVLGFGDLPQVIEQ